MNHGLKGSYNWLSYGLRLQMVFVFLFVNHFQSNVSISEKHWLKNDIVKKRVKRNISEIFLSSCFASIDGS